MTAAEKQKRKSGKGNINSFVFFLILGEKKEQALNYDSRSSRGYIEDPNNLFKLLMLVFI